MQKCADIMDDPMDDPTVEAVFNNIQLDVLLLGFNQALLTIAAMLVLCELFLEFKHGPIL